MIEGGRVEALGDAGGGDSADGDAEAERPTTGGTSSWRGTRTSSTTSAIRSCDPQPSSGKRSTHARLRSMQFVQQPRWTCKC